MKKKVLSLFMALSLALTAMPTVAWANDSSDEDWTAYVKEDISFTKGNETAPEWIDRIDLPEFAKDFYDVLVEASDGDGNDDYLMDAKYYSLDEAEEMEDEPIWVISDNREDGTEYKSIILEATTVTLQNELDDAQKKMVENAVNGYVSAAYSAFDADHPEVFWLYRKAIIGGFSIESEDELKYVAGLTLAEYKVNEDRQELFYQNRAQQFLNDAGKLYIPGVFINKSEDVTDRKIIAEWATGRANEIIADFSKNLEGFKAHLKKNGLISEEDLGTDNLEFSKLTKAGKIAYFDYWLVSNNDYNTDLSNETETPFGGSLDAVSARECISAMVGKKGNQGPVCAGFTRGMKALCDTAGIGCVIVESIPEEKHTWNYVQVDNGDWFGQDTTWNEAEGEAVADYLLANRATMDEKHTVENKGWGNIIFPDTPAIQESRFIFAPGWLVNVDASNKRITEIKEVKIDGITAPVLGKVPVTTGFSINKDTAHVSISKNEEDVEIPITWTDANGVPVGSNFAANTVYQATFMIEPDDNFTFGNNTKVMITGAPEGTETSLDASKGKVIVTFPTTENNAPVFSPNGGSFRGSQAVAITAPDGYEIYYTTDGVVPNQDLTKEGNTTVRYEKEILLTATTTIKAIAVKDDMVSAVAEATFTKTNSGGSSGGGSGSSTAKPTAKPSEKPTASAPVTVEGADGIKAEVAKAEANTAAEKAAKADESVALVTDGTSVSGKDFTEPAVLKVPVDTKDVKDVNHLTLAKLNPETGKLEIIGGTYDADAKAVIGYADVAGDYFVVEKDGLTSINLQIDNNGVVLNNTNKVMDAAPVISQNRTMVPLRFIAEAFGANVSWAEATKTVTIVIDGKVLTMTIGQDLEGFGAAPIISNGRTMVPISYISKAMDAHVIWVPSTKTVAIAK